MRGASAKSISHIQLGKHLLTILRSPSLIAVCLRPMPSQSEDTEVRNNASGGNVTAPSQLSASHPEERNIPDNYQVADLDF